MFARTCTRVSGRLLQGGPRRSTCLPSITTATVAGTNSPLGIDAARRLHLPFDPVASVPAGTAEVKCATGNGAGDPAVAMMAKAPIVAKFKKLPIVEAAERGWEWEMGKPL